MRLIAAFAVLVFLVSGAFISKADNVEMRVFKIKSRAPESLVTVVKGLMSGEGKVTADSNSNSLIIFDYPDNIDTISDVIEKLDIEDKQIEIGVVIAEVDDGFLESIGIRHGGSIVPAGDFNRVLEVLDGGATARIRSRMAVRTLSNRPAKIQASVDEIFPQRITRYEDGREVVSIGREPVGDILEVLPRANSDGTIEITLRPSSSTLDEERRVQERSILTQVVIKSGDTVTIGGVNTTREVSRSGTFSPLKTPVSKSSFKGRGSVLMFLTATIAN
ncbi:MAG: secretin N-terminal domain-containing protein [Candidatus Omnitrophota bacterium]